MQFQLLKTSMQIYKIENKNIATFLDKKHRRTVRGPFLCHDFLTKGKEEIAYFRNCLFQETCKRKVTTF